jgi:hypothetical protein
MSAYTTLRITREQAVRAIVEKKLEEESKRLKTFYALSYTDEGLERICEELEISGALYNYIIVDDESKSDFSH